ncbi:hypothetical protein [Corynebacterium propinquum]
MRLTESELLAEIAIDEATFKQTIQDLGIIFGSDGAIDKRMAIALIRYFSDEARELFGPKFLFPARRILFAHGCETSLFDRDSYVGEWRLDLHPYGLLSRGRCTLQSESEAVFEEKFGISLSEKPSSTLVLIRETDLSFERALMDAYFLGDGRLKHAIAQKMRKENLIGDQAA